MQNEAVMTRDFSRIDGRTFDLLVCGGGIYGAWTAYDAARRGLNTALVDQADWAGATSSASSKLIHGGLRYLETFDFGLVRKTLAERRMLLACAPHRVRPLRFGVPVFRGGRIGSFRLTTGLALYDWLARPLARDDRFQYFSAGEFARRFPFLTAEGLQAGFTYLDSQTDDARLVLELMAGAMGAGAICVNYCKVTELLERDGRLYAARLQDQAGGESGIVYAKQFVNTAGQWAHVLQNEERGYRLTKGVHLVLPKTVEQEALLLTAKADGRVFFMIPWYGRTLVGTTDTDYRGDLDQVRVENRDIDYLLAEVNRVLKQGRWTAEDVIATFAGLRVLKQNDQASPSAVSRDWELKIAKNGLLTSIGGKLTSARSDAAHIVDKICENLGIQQSCATRGKALPWSPGDDFTAWSDAMARIALDLNIDGESAKWLLFRHGRRVMEVFALCEHHAELSARILPEVPFIVADLVFCARTEMVVHLDDLLRRRLPLLILAKPSRDDLRRIAAIVAPELGWNEDRIESECRSVLSRV
ncbi:MAG: glycerol-3-phosphate dehydrogenase/oxidase [Gammaproteobacteria bacterium]